MAKHSTEEGPIGGYTHKPSIEDTQKTKAVKRVETVEYEPTPEPEPEATPKINIFTNVLWFLFFAALLWISDIAGEAIPTPIDDMIYDTAIAILFGTLASLGVFTKRKKS